MPGLSPEETLAAKIETAIQPLLDASVTPIIGRRDDCLFQFGTGTYFAVGEHQFLVTAAHVFRKARKEQVELFVPQCGEPTAKRQLISLGGMNVTDARRKFDVAVAELSSAIVEQIPNRRFLHLNDVRFVQPTEGGWFYIAGHPQVLYAESEPGRLIAGEGICYLTRPYEGETNQV